MNLYKQKYRGTPYRRWTLDVRDHLGVRRKVQAFSDKAASATLGHKIERLVAFRVAHRPLDGELTAWIESLPPALRTRLADLDLIDAETTGGPAGVFE